MEGDGSLHLGDLCSLHVLFKPLLTLDARRSSRTFHVDSNCATGSSYGATGLVRTSGAVDGSWLAAHADLAEPRATWQPVPCPRSARSSFFQGRCVLVYCIRLMSSKPRQSEATWPHETTTPHMHCLVFPPPAVRPGTGLRVRRRAWWWWRLAR